MNISLIIPCYNEELNIQKGVLDRIGNYTVDNKDFFEVIIVDDGSMDESVNMISKYYPRKFPKIKLIQKEHHGKALTLIEGIRSAKGDYIIFSDMDLATPLEESKKIIAEFKNGYDIVIGSRAGRRQGAPLKRKLQSYGFTLLKGLLVGLRNVSDTQCGFKGFKKDAALAIIDNLNVFTPEKSVRGSSVSAGFDLEFLFLAKKMGYEIKEVPVEWHHAETKNVAFVKDSIETIKDLLRIRMSDMQGAYRTKKQR